MLKDYGIFWIGNYSSVRGWITALPASYTSSNVYDRSPKWGHCQSLRFSKEEADALAAYWNTIGIVGRYEAQRLPK